MEKTGKIIRFLKTGVCIFLLGAVVFAITASWLNNRAGRVDEAVVEYGQSQLYSREDMDAAADILKEEFKEFKGCELHEIFYISDECSEEKRIELNEQGNSYAECMVFGTSFHTPKFSGQGLWDKDKEYTCWQWIFVKDVSGTWQLISYGHP
jgi:hypothetical protein